MKQRGFDDAGDRRLVQDACALASVERGDACAMGGVAFGVLVLRR